MCRKKRKVKADVKEGQSLSRGGNEPKILSEFDKLVLPRKESQITEARFPQNPVIYDDSAVIVVYNKTQRREENEVSLRVAKTTS